MASILLGRRRPPILSTVPLILSSPHNIAAFSTCSRGLAPVVKKKQPHGRRNLIRRYASNVATTVAAGGVVSIAVILAGLWLGQRRIIWVGQAANGVAFDPQPIDPSLGGEVIRLGPTHVGYYFPPKKKKNGQSRKARTVVYFHGNGDQLGFGAAYLGPIFSNAGLGFLGVEYPGYGLACYKDRDGTETAFPSEAGAIEAAEALMRHLRVEMNVGIDETILVGQSIGCAIALVMAERAYGGRLVLISPFTSLKDMAGIVLPWLRPIIHFVGPWLLRDSLDNRKRAADVFGKMPTLIVHGTEDDVVPFSQGKTLSAEFREGDECHFVPLPGFGHNDVWEYTGMIDVGEGVSEKRSLLGLIADFATKS